MIKYKVKITGQLSGNSISMEIPVELDLNEQVLNEAISEAQHYGIQDVEIQSFEELGEVEQLSIPFEEQDEYTESTEDDSEEAYTPYTAPEEVNQPEGYTSYASTLSQGGELENEESAESKAQESSTAAPSYVPYASSLKKNQNKAISFVPKIGDRYVPYARKIVAIPEKYLKHDFK